MEDSDIKPKELYDIVRKQIEHEDELVNQRLNWFLVTQGFLIGAYATVFTVDVEKLGDKKLLVVPVLLCIGILGIGLSILSYAGIRIAHESIMQLTEYWENNVKTFQNKKTGLNFPKIIWKAGIGQWSACYTSMGITTLFVFVWLILLAIVTISDLKIECKQWLPVLFLGIGLVVVGVMLAKINIKSRTDAN